MSITTSLERVVAQAQFGCIEPLQFVAKKRSRMSLLGIDDLNALPRATIDLGDADPDCAPGCAEIIESQRRYLAKYLFGGRSPAFVHAPWRGIPLVLDLAEYPDFACYAARLKRHSKGALIRDIDRAKGRGFYCEPFDRQYHSEDRYRIDTSATFRSGGLFLPSVLSRMPQRRAGTAPLECLHHWYSDWGVFEPDSAASGLPAEAVESGRRLVGYLFLKRIGAMIRLTALLGHGAYLRHGVVKLLLFDMLKWLLDRRDPRVAGIRYVHAGAAEQCGTGLVEWKRRFQFEPCLFDWQAA